MEAALTTVVDAGARYGMHPSWRPFAGELRYLAFEPDADEASRLGTLGGTNLEVIPLALGSVPGRLEFHVSQHRGYCSLLELDSDCLWFKHRPGEDLVEEEREVEVVSLDDYMLPRWGRVDFLKVDTEGTEHDVLLGAENILRSQALGLRSGIFFQPMYKGQALFPQMCEYLTELGFILLNIDYFGRGLPACELHGNPDPLGLDIERYGVMFSSDAVWVRKLESLPELFSDREALECAVLKYAYFCFLNYAPDLACEALLRQAQRQGSRFQGAVTETELYKGLRRRALEYLGRWKVLSDYRWDKARQVSREVFGVELEGGSRYWEIIQAL